MSLCVLAGGKMLVLAATAFTLSWTHSVEKIRWTEHWLATPAGLVVDMGRVEGSGNGIGDRHLVTCLWVLWPNPVVSNQCNQPGGRNEPRDWYEE